MTLKERVIHYFKKSIQIIGILLLAFMLLVFAISQEWLGALPSIEEIKNPHRNVSSVIYSSDYQELGKFFIENRTELNYSQIPPHTINALLATEDNRFREHSGVDIFGISSAVFRTFIMGKKSGASTITQQLAKNLFHNTGRKNILVRLIQKVKEWYIAIQLERNFSKNEILALYLNTVPFLHNSYGIKEAAKTYFNKEVEKLSVLESAVLIGMLKGPSLYNPKSNPENAKNRRNTVLAQMLKYHYITQKEYDELLPKPIVLDYNLTSHSSGLAPYLREEIRMEIDELLSDKTKPNGSKYNIYSDGLKIFTTIDYRMQLHAEKSVAEHMKWLQSAFLKEWGGKDPYKYGAKKNPELIRDIVRQMEDYKILEEEGKKENEIFAILQKKKRPMRIFTWNGDKDTSMSLIDSIKYYKNILQAGMCAMDAHTGRILAWVGGIDFNHFKLDHVRKSTRRQVGSTIKPLLYAVALENGESPCSEVPYSKPIIPGFEDWDPKGSKNFAEGQLVSLKDGLQVSDNRVAAQLIKKYGPSSLAEMAKNLGIEADFELVPAISLGTTDISLYEMIGAYSPFMNGGIYHQPYYIDRIEDAKGNVLYQNERISKEVLSSRTSVLMNLMMQGVATGKGTASRLRKQYGLKMEIAAKTGTTQANTDGWFIGATPNILCAVWVGADDPAITFASTGLGQGASSALPIWAKFIAKITADKEVRLDNRKTFIAAKDSILKVEMNCVAAPILAPENKYDEEEE